MEDKQLFVKGLERFLKKYLPNLKIKKIEYGVYDDKEEYVYISITNGYHYRIPITGDSEIAIIKDVIRKLEG